VAEGELLTKNAKAGATGTPEEGAEESFEIRKLTVHQIVMWRPKCPST